MQRYLFEFLTNRKIENVIFRNLKTVSSVLREQFTVQEKKCNVNGVNINYLKTGKGDHPLLLLPGSMGSIWTDFKPQIENLDKEKFTIIAWDPPGYGKSRPPDRTFPKNFLRRDADWAYNLMKILGYNKFSLLGWSHGGITALILAAKYPENIRKLIVLCSNTYITSGEMEIYEIGRDISTWSKRMRTSMIDIYGETYLKDIWGKWNDAMKDIYENNKGNICKEDLPKIKCPTLIVRGGNDITIHPEHSDYMKNNIKHSRIEIFEDGGHNLHLQNADKFNALVSDFLSEQTEYKD